MENTEHIQKILSRVQFLADVSLVAQCDLEEFKIAMSLISDLAQGTISAENHHKALDEALEYLKKREQKNML
ncbi:EF-hand domain-containing protein [Brenneria corticis]|uniref:EH domain-containing protein n=1 Tax=Brenneria corticis TaxID=2173106 RepID=A0A2U1TJL1_9GAMM|nr:EF-hand domain-containing protein [Brenneria sp. CFCC 11842]PWC09587.1 hypothetical protein DDT56_23580 [Brenneria sp. CFCC 11842]